MDIHVLCELHQHMTRRSGVNFRMAPRRFWRHAAPREIPHSSQPQQLLVRRNRLGFSSPDGINPVRDDITLTRLICSALKNDASNSSLFMLEATSTKQFKTVWFAEFNADRHI